MDTIAFDSPFKGPRPAVPASVTPMRRTDLADSPAILDAALDAVVSIDADGRVVEWNAAAERMFGDSRDEAMSRYVADLLVPERDRPAHWAGLRRAVEGGETRIVGERIEVMALCADGSEIPVELTVTLVGEDPPSFTAWIRDLSEAREREVRDARRTELMRRAERLGDVGSWEWRPEPDEVVWSDNLYRIFGYEPGEIVPSVELVVEATHPDDRDRLTRNIEVFRRRGMSPPIDFRIIRPDGAVHDLRGTLALVDTAKDGTQVMLGSVQDLTERRRSEREINAHLAVSEALDAWDGFEGGADRLLRDLGQALAFDVGALWLPGEEGLAVRRFWQADSLDLEDFRNETAELCFERGEGVIGGVWEELEPAILPDLGAVDEYWRQVAAESAGLRSAVVLPVRDGDDLIAVLEFYSRDEVVATDRLRRSLAGIGNEVGHFLARRRGELAPFTLTPREQEVLQLAAHGHSGRRIAEMLVVSPATVKTHFEHAYEKLEVSDRASAVAKALRLGLIE